MSNRTITLGATYTDKITGFSGVATGHVEYMTGCNQTLLAPKVTSDGGRVSAEWFDDQRLAIEPIAVIVLDKGATPGCDRAAPVR